MKSDFYTKAVLTVIAVMLSIIAENQFAKPVSARAASEQTQFAIAPDGYLYVYQDGSNVVKRYDPLGSPIRDLHLGNR